MRFVKDPASGILAFRKPPFLIIAAAHASTLRTSTTMLEMLENFRVVGAPLLSSDIHWPTKGPRKNLSTLRVVPLHVLDLIRSLVTQHCSSESLSVSFTVFPFGEGGVRREFSPSVILGAKALLRRA